MATSKVGKKPHGRPLLYTPQVASEILDRLSAGETLQSICGGEGMPAVSTVNSWTNEDAPKGVPTSFAGDYAQARARGFDAIASETLRIADTPLEGVEVTTKADGGVEEKRGDMLGHRKLQIDTRKWLLARWDPKRYGDRQLLEHSGNIGIGDRLKRAEERNAGD